MTLFPSCELLATFTMFCALSADEKLHVDEASRPHISQISGDQAPLSCIKGGQYRVGDYPGAGHHRVAGSS